MGKSLFILIFFFLSHFSGFSQDCDLQKKVDKFDKSEMIWTSTNEFVDLTKVITDETVDFYLTLKVQTSHIAKNKTGVYVLFEDGSKWEFPLRDIKFDVNRPLEYYSYDRLTLRQVKTLMSKRISDFKLYIYDSEVPVDIGNLFMKEVKCIYNAK